MMMKKFLLKKKNILSHINKNIKNSLIKSKINRIEIIIIKKIIIIRKIEIIIKIMINNFQRRIIII